MPLAFFVHPHGVRSLEILVALFVLWVVVGLADVLTDL